MYIPKLREASLDVLMRINDDDYPNSRYINPALRDQLIYLFRQYLAGYVTRKKLVKYLSKDVHLGNLDIVDLIQHLHDIKDEETIRFSPLDVESNSKQKKSKRHTKQRKGGEVWIRSRQKFLKKWLLRVLP